MLIKLPVHQDEGTEHWYLNPDSVAYIKPSGDIRTQVLLISGDWLWVDLPCPQVADMVKGSG